MGEVAEQPGLECAARNLQRNLYRLPPDGHTPSIADIPVQPRDEIGKHGIDIVQAGQQSNDIRREIREPLFQNLSQENL